MAIIQNGSLFETGTVIASLHGECARFLQACQERIDCFVSYTLTTQKRFGVAIQRSVSSYQPFECRLCAFTIAKRGTPDREHPHAITVRTRSYVP